MIANSCEGRGLVRIPKASRVFVLPLIALLFWATVLTPGVQSQEIGEALRCARVDMSPPLTWSFSGVWSLSESDRLLLTNPARGEIFSVDAQGRVLPLGDTFGGAGGLEITKVHGIGVLKMRDRYIALDEDPKFLDASGRERFNSQFHLLHPDLSHDQSLMITGRLDYRGTKLLRVYSWAISSNETSIAAFADIEFVDGQQASAIISMELFADSFTILESLSIPHQIRTLYMLGYPYLAKLSETDTIYLKLGEEIEMKVGSVDGLARRSKPKEIRIFDAAVAIPPRKQGIRNISEIFSSLATNNFIAGVYQWRSRTFLLVLSETESELAPNVWHLREIDPATGREIGRFRLPTAAPHVMVIPGDEYWAVFEKGPVFGFKHQLIESLWTIPSAFLNKPGLVSSSPITGGCYWE